MQIRMKLHLNLKDDKEVAFFQRLIMLYYAMYGDNYARWISEADQEDTPEPVDERMRDALKLYAAALIASKQNIN